MGVEEVYVMRDKQTHIGKGAAFVTMSTAAEAQQAIYGLHNQRIVQGMSTALQVKLAEGEEEQGGVRPIKLFVGRLPMNTSEEALRSVFASYGNVTEVVILNNGAAFVRYDNRQAGEEAIARLHGQTVFEGQAGPLTVRVADSDEAKSVRSGVQFVVGVPVLPSGASPAVQGPSGPQAMGPQGANLFIKDFPPEFTNDDLRAHFERFGTVLSAKVFCDKVTGVSKGFGFISYTDAYAANEAVGAMNGCQVGSHRLKVQIKQEQKPY
eukprot:NODE_473_length_899_cov_322.063144_g465_i0.p1 GENE.NODE_473_length_899_cov_322.063144_g465_i0~~NODE_473_length_899_cov_322.063144_g465_i0.p1  ORF type:complete len:266 (+),score=37.09 NODE_473_length_899_cov_322.063144_g465_i0:41-838(+)